jgi:Domain of unknown function (DUF4386)
VPRGSCANHGWSGGLTDRCRCNDLPYAADVSDDIWHAGLILFGAHLMAIGYLAYRSVTVPRVLGIVYLVVGAGYLIDRFSSFLLSGHSINVAASTGPGEVALVFWLLLKGARSPSPADPHSPDDRAAV